MACKSIDAIDAPCKTPQDRQKEKGETEKEKGEENQQ
jgi:hypothetical protein